MDRQTVDIYDANADEYRQARKPRRMDEAAAFGSSIPAGRWRVDLGCGPGRHTGQLGEPLVAMDAALAMVRTARQSHPHAFGVAADLEYLPCRAGGLHGGWASMTYHHMPSDRLPMALADLHRALVVDAPIDLTAVAGGYEGTDFPDDDFPGRYFAGWSEPWITDVVVGAGFSIVAADIESSGHGDNFHIAGRRLRTLADTVAADMRLLVCGLNPSIYAADDGVGYARPGNRFWPAAVAAGVVTRPLDSVHALREHGVGMTDLVKRATARADQLSADDYRAGAARVARLVEWLKPGAVCFVGLTGYRAAVDAKAVAGPQRLPFAGRPTYVMPSTSGLNAHARPADLVDHLQAAAALADSAG